LDRLDKQSLGYLESLDFPIQGPDGKEYRVFHKDPNNKIARWRWSKETVQQRYNELVFKNGNVYTKNYQKEGTIPRSLLIEERFGRTRTGKTIAVDIFGVQLFDNPKPIQLIQHLLSISASQDATVLDFFAGSGTTGHAVLDLNKQDGGNRTFILCQLNEKTDTTPNGIAYDVTAKRLKRIMTGACYDGTTDFKWAQNNTPYGGNLEVVEMASVTNCEWIPGQTPFDVIDETLYGKQKFGSVKEKVAWVCSNFDKTQNYLEEQKTEE